MSKKKDFRNHVDELVSKSDAMIQEFFNYKKTNDLAKASAKSKDSSLDTEIHRTGAAAAQTEYVLARFGFTKKLHNIGYTNILNQNKVVEHLDDILSETAKDDNPAFEANMDMVRAIIKFDKKQMKIEEFKEVTQAYDVLRGTQYSKSPLVELKA